MTKVMAKRGFKAGLLSLLIVISMILLSVFLTESAMAESEVSVPDVSPTVSESGEQYLDIVAANLYYGDSIRICYGVDMNLPDGLSPEGVKMLFWNSIPTSYTIDAAPTYAAEIDGDMNTLDNDISLYGYEPYEDCASLVSYPIAAKEIGDTVYARAYITDSEGEVYYSEVVKYSVIDYLYSRYEEMANGAVISEKQTSVYEKLINYGLKAQEVFEYRLERPVNADIVSFSVSDGHIADGFTGGRYLVGDELTLVADMSEGGSFLYWSDSEGNTVSTSRIFKLKMTAELDKEVYTAVYGEYAPTAEVLPAKDGANGIVAIIHDDGTLDTVYSLDELFYEYGLVGDIAIIKNKVSSASNIATWQKVLDTERWKLVCHSETHTWWGTATDNGDGTYTFADNETKLYNEVVAFRDYLCEKFPSQRVLTFAYPGFADDKRQYAGGYFGEVGTDVYNNIRSFIYSENARELIADTYIAARYDSDLAGNGAYLDSVKEYNYMNGGFIRTDHVANGTIAARLEDAANGGIHTFSLHTSTETGGDITLSAMEEVCRMLSEYVKEGKIWNTHYEDAILYVKEAQNSSVSVSGGSDKISVTLTDTLDDSIYDYALTVRVKVPASWQACKVTQGNDVSYAVAKTVDGDRVVDINIVPDRAVAELTPVSASDVPEAEKKEPAEPIKPITKIDSVESFDGEKPNYTLSSGSEALKGEANIVSPENYDGGKMLELVAKNTGVNDYWRVSQQRNSISASAMIFSFKYSLDEAKSSGMLQQIYFSDANKTPYFITVNTATGGYYLGDINSNNGATVSNKLTDTLEYGKVYDIRVEICITGAGGFLATTYVDGVKTAESTNFANYTKAEGAIPKTTVERVEIASLQSSLFTAKIDDVTLKAGSYEFVGLTPPKAPEPEYVPDSSLALDMKIDFETDLEGSFEYGERDGKRTLKLVDATNSMGSWNIPFGKTVNVDAFTFTFDINVKSASSGFNTDFFFASGANNPYMLYVNGGGSGYSLGDCQSNSGGAGKTTASLSGSLSYNTWYTVKIEVVINGENGFLATWYLMNGAGEFVKTGESKNFGNYSRSETAVPQNTVSFFGVSSLSSATIEMYLDNLIIKAGTLKQLGFVEPDFEMSYDFDEATEGITSSSPVTYTSEAPTAGASNALLVNKTATGYKLLSLKAGSAIANASDFTLSFDINVVSGSSRLVQLMFNSDTAATPYDLTIEPSADGYRFGDLSNLSGGSATTFDMDLLEYGKTYHVSLTVLLGDKDSFKAILALDGEEVGVSTNYYKVNGSANDPYTAVDGIYFHWQNSSTFKLYLDNLSLKAYEAEEEMILPEDSAEKEGYLSFTDDSDTNGYKGNAHTVTGGKLYTGSPTGWETTTFLYDGYKSSEYFAPGAEYVFEAEYTYLGGTLPADTSGVAFLGFLNKNATTNKDMWIADYIKYPGVDANGDGIQDYVTFFGTKFEVGKTYNLKITMTSGATVTNGTKKQSNVYVYIDGELVKTYVGTVASTAPESDEVLYGFGIYYRGASTSGDRIGGYSCCFDNVRVSANGEVLEREFGAVLENGHTLDKNYFPGFTRKTVTFTLDDGLEEYDSKVIEILRPAKITGTFNICDAEYNKDIYSLATYLALYEGFEIANHHILHTTGERDGFDYSQYTFTDSPLPAASEQDYNVFYKNYTKVDADGNGVKEYVPEGFYYVHYSVYGSSAGWHPFATDETYIKYLELTTDRIEDVFGEGSVVGFAYPHGQVPPAVKEYLKNAGYLYARKTGNLGAKTDFALPTDRFAWTYNADHNSLLSVMAQFDAVEDDGKLRMFSFGVHAKDFETADKWDDLRTFAELYGNREDDFWYATNREIFEYEDALNALEVTSEKIINSSDVDVYVKVDGVKTVIEAHSEYVFETIEAN